MFNLLLITIGKLITQLSKLLNLGNGSTWPGHIALSLNKNFIREIVKNSNLKIILIAGTNGKTTTSRLSRSILLHSGKNVLLNESGANLLNGIASTLLLHTNLEGKVNKEYAIFEIDENTLPLILKELTPDFVVLLNLFRDQLDRYGEVDNIARNWKTAFAALPASTTLILNADDPQIAYLGEEIKARTIYFGLDDKKSIQTMPQHASDSIYCPRCSERLFFKTVYFSHIGIWECRNCKLKRPTLNINSYSYYPLPGVYNKYNIHAVVLLTRTLGIDNTDIDEAVKNFKPAFGRQEIVKYKNKQIRIFLSKNPTSYNESLRTVQELDAKTVLLILNDHIADGRDVSWIWDIDMEKYLPSFEHILITGTRAYDMGLRVKYATGSQKFTLLENIQEAVEQGIQSLKDSETLYILPTYTAMLDVRKIITGRKIL